MTKNRQNIVSFEASPEILTTLRLISQLPINGNAFATRSTYIREFIKQGIIKHAESSPELHQKVKELLTNEK